MPISVSQVHNKQSFVELYDGELTVYYRLIDDFTLEDDAKMATAAQRGKATAIAQGVIERVIANVVSWDLLDKPEKEGGKPIPLTKEALSKLPGDILTDVLAAIRQDKQPPGNE